MRATPPHSDNAKKAASRRGWWQRLGQELRAVVCSMQLAVLLLSLILLCCLLGTVIPQEGLVETYQLKAQFASYYPIMKAMGLFGLFSAPWFIALEVLFFFSVLFGSFRWLRPAYRSATLQTYLSSRHIRASQGGERARPWLSIEAPATEQTELLLSDVLGAALKRQGYKVTSQKPASAKSAEDTLWLYARRHNSSRFGPILAHIGILLMLIASLQGAFSSFLAKAVVRPGETFRLEEAEFFQTSVPLAYWIGSLPSWQVRVDGFAIDYYPKHPTVARQYTTRLSIVDKQGKTLASGTTAVNAPFRYEAVTFYQASYAPTGTLRFRVNDKAVPLQADKRLAGRPFAEYPLSAPGVKAPMVKAPAVKEQVVKTDPQAAAFLVFPYFRQPDGVHADHVQVFFQKGERIVGLAGQNAPEHVTLLEGEEKAFQGYRLAFDGPEFATGLQMKKAPEFPLMALGFLIISAGVVLSLRPQRQLWFSVTPAAWLQQDKTEPLMLVWLYARTNKARTRFSQERQQLREAVKGALEAAGLPVKDDADTQEQGVC